MNNRPTPVSLHQLLQQLYDFSLDRHVERRGRLVGNDEACAGGQRHCDHHALAHTAGQLVRVERHPAIGIGNSDLAQEIDGTTLRVGLADRGVGANGGDDLRSDGKHGIECGNRLLEDHADLAATHLAHLGFGQRGRDRAPRT